MKALREMSLSELSAFREQMWNADWKKDTRFADAIREAAGDPKVREGEAVMMKHVAAALHQRIETLETRLAAIEQRPN